MVQRRHAQRGRAHRDRGIFEYSGLRDGPHRSGASGHRRSHCSITHHATLHGCTIGDHVLVGINATVYGGAVIGDNSIVGQHAYVRDGTIVPPNSVVVGSPAKVIRTANNWIANRLNALFYHRNARAYAVGDHRAWDGAEFEDWAGQTMAAVQAEFAALHPAA